MTYRLPSLNTLRAFEAAARHSSFQTAASELGVKEGDGVDIEIIEAHHRHKVDAPSGTALRMTVGSRIPINDLPLNTLVDTKCLS